MKQTSGTILFAVLSALQVLLLGSCGKETFDSVVPEYDVKYSCNTTLVNTYLQQTEQTHLDCLGGYVRVFDKKTLAAGDIVGVGGLLILQNFEGAFYVYDLACPHCFSQGKTGGKVSRIEMKEDGFSAVCKSCGSEFGAIFWGSPAPTAGPANADKLILRQYKARLLPDGVTVTVSR